MTDKVILITSGTTWTVPADFTSVNKIEVIGGGASAASNGRTGGGGGAWSQILNSALTPNASVNIQIGQGGAGVSGTNTLGNPGTDTWFRIDGGSGAPATTSEGTMAKGGAPGATTIVDSLGGAAASGVGSSKFSGGKGTGTGTGSSGGGAGGPNGDGGVGLVTDHGGAGDAGSGGAGGTFPGGNGGAGTERALTAGGTAGSGGGGGCGGTPPDAGTSGLYGAGAGGRNDTNTGPNGAIGCIIVTYTPSLSNFLMLFY